MVGHGTRSGPDAPTAGPRAGTRPSAAEHYRTVAALLTLSPQTPAWQACATTT